MPYNYYAFSEFQFETMYCFGHSPNFSFETKHVRKINFNWKTLHISTLSKYTRIDSRPKTLFWFNIWVIGFIIQDYEMHFITEFVLLIFRFRAETPFKLKCKKATRKITTCYASRFRTCCYLLFIIFHWFTKPVFEIVLVIFEIIKAFLSAEVFF